LGNYFDKIDDSNDDDDDVHINRDWKNDGKNIKSSTKENLIYFELEQQRPWFDE
jgi:hypothetical protein